MPEQEVQLDTTGDGVGDTTAKVGGDFQKVGDYCADDGGEWEMAMRLKKAPRPVVPVITISKPEVAVKHKSKPATGLSVEWFGFPRRHVIATVVLLTLVISGGYFGWRVTVDEQTGAMQVIRDQAAADAAKIRAQLEANARADQLQRAKDSATIEALQARLADLQKPAAGAETRDNSTATTQPPPAGFTSGQFRTWADARAFVIYLGHKAEKVDEVAARAAVAQRELRGETWRIIDLRGTAPTPAAPTPAPSGPPAGYVQIPDSEYRALKDCRDLLTGWAAQASRSPWWRLKNDERDALRSAIGASR